jgi:restriction system protein
MAAAAAKLPWYLALGAAVASFVVLHIASATAPPLQPLQFIVPLAFLILAGWSFWSRRHSLRLQDLLASDDLATALEALSWRDFERLVGEAFRRRGFHIDALRRGASGDEFDLEMTRNGESFFAQCKHWRARKVGIVSVRELYGAMEARGAAGGFVITSGGFSPEARSFAEGRNVELIDGPNLNSMISPNSDDSCDTQRVAIVRAIEAERLLEAAPEPPRRQYPRDDARIRRAKGD